MQHTDPPEPSQKAASSLRTACHCGRHSYSQHVPRPKLTRLALKACKSRVSSLRRPSSCIMRQDAMASHSCTHDVSAACAQHPSSQTTRKNKMCRRSRSLTCRPSCAGNMPPRPRRERQATQCALIGARLD